MTSTTKADSQKLWKLVVISHTHWDREWYLPFQEFRLKLVRLVDEVLSILQRDPGYRYFMLDGQTVVLEDYLEIRPERRAEIEALVREGRLLIGPWYVLPDEFLVSGEALIRNLQIGHEIAGRFGRVMKVGYIPDPFGHIAQMPQILRGFGIDSAVIWRGVPEDVGTSEFCWQSPDGSEVFTLFLPLAYSNARALPADREQLRNRLRYLRDQLEPYATTDYLVLMNGNDHAYPQPNLSSILATADQLFEDVEVVHGNLPDLIDALRQGRAVRGAEAGPRPLPTVVGELRCPKRAHLLPGVFSTRMWIKERNHACESLLEKWAEPFSAWAQLQETTDGVVVDATLDRPETMSAETQRASWPGLIERAWKYLLQNQAHDSICGCSVDQVHEEMRTRYDWSEQIARAVGREALNLLVRTIDTASLAARDAETRGHGDAETGRRGDGEPVGHGVPASPRLTVSASGAEAGPGPDRPVFVVVFNAIDGARTDFVSTTAQGPAGRDFLLLDDAGSPIPYQVLRSGHRDVLSTEVSRSDLRTMLDLVSGGDPTEWPREKIEALESVLTLMGGEMATNQIISGVEIRPTPDADTVQIDIDTAESGEHAYAAIGAGLREVAALVGRGDVERFRLRVRRRDEVEIGFVARAVPGFGYRTYRILPGHRQPQMPPVTDNEPYLDNEFFTVNASPRDGTLTVIDKETGAVEQGLNLFVDGGDAGDEYNYSPPPNDLIVSGPAEPPKIALVENGPARLSLRVEQVMRLPEALGPDRQNRSRKQVDCAIVSTVTLYPGVRRIDVETVVDNRAADHRLRAHFPARLIATASQSEGHFGVIERPVEVAPAGPDWAESPVGTYPQRSFADVSDGTVGVLIANRGLPEYEVLRTDRGTTIALTLLRCVGWLSRDDLELRRGHAGPPLPTPGAQCPGRHTFRYAIVPHAGTWQGTFHQAHGFNHALQAIVTDRHPGLLPLQMSLVEVEPATAVVSAIREPREGDGLVVRLYNAESRPTRARLKLGLPFRRAELVNLAEGPLGELPSADGRAVELELAPGKIVTIRFRF